MGDYVEGCILAFFITPAFIWCMDWWFNFVTEFIEVIF